VWEVYNRQFGYTKWTFGELTGKCSFSKKKACQIDYLVEKMNVMDVLGLNRKAEEWYSAQTLVF
jgi:hypothetical protein